MNLLHTELLHLCNLSHFTAVVEAKMQEKE